MYLQFLAAPLIELIAFCGKLSDTVGMLWGLLFQFLTSVMAYDYGIDRLQDPSVDARIKGKRVAVLAHAASVDKTGHHLIDLLRSRYDLRKIFTPEHGLRSVSDGLVADGVDPQTGLPVISLYKDATHAPRLSDLEDVDLVVMDLQDVGVRYYTHFSTIAEFLKVMAQIQKPVMILDRPNPIGGDVVEGETLKPEFAGAFISYLQIPTRHGMTLGELAKLFVAESNLPVSLDVITVKGWNRESLVFAKADRPWVPSSPALQNLEQVYLYAALGSMEQFNLSVGRGTDNSLAFHVLAAPWITAKEAEALVTELNAMKWPGLIFTPIEFQVTRDVYLGQTVRGVRMDASAATQALRADEVSFRLAEVFQSYFPTRLKFSKYAPNYYGSSEWVDAILSQKSWDDLLPGLDERIEAFKKRRALHLLYSFDSL